MLKILTQELELSFSFGKATCETSWRWDTLERPMTDYDLWYAWNGEGEIQLNGIPYSISKGSCFLFRPGDLIKCTHNPLKPLTVTYIHFGMTLEPELAFPAYLSIRDMLVFETFLNRYVNTMLTKDSASEEEARMVLKLLLLQYFRESIQLTSLPAKGKLHLFESIHEVANVIRQDPGKNHRMIDLAKRAGLSGRYFSIKFKEIIGQTVENFIIMTKIDRAEHLLRFTGMNVTEVAEALGYNNIYFFSTQFKKFRGVAPSAIGRSNGPGFMRITKTKANPLSDRNLSIGNLD